MSLSALEACDQLRFSDLFTERLSTADQLLSTQPELGEERKWIRAAQERVAAAAEGCASLLDRVRDLPELADVREELAEGLQQQWVDALEKLHAGITFQAGSRAPVIEAVFPHLKLAPLRRASREAGGEYQRELERRLGTAYVTRIFSQADFGFVPAVVAQVKAAYAAWQSCFEAPTLDPAAARPLRQELVAAGTRVELAIRQARLLAEAALLPLPDGFERAGLGVKPKRRTARAASPDELEDPAPATEVTPLPEEASAGAEPPPAPTKASGRTRRRGPGKSPEAEVEPR